MNPAMTDRAALPVHSTRSSVTGQGILLNGATSVAGEGGPGAQLTWMPEMARLMTRRWISEVPSKMV
jgi:hypothetical protein